ncbi:MAG: ABC transporter permease subunit [Nocardioidaceae bacterium]
MRKHLTSAALLLLATVFGCLASLGSAGAADAATAAAGNDKINIVGKLLDTRTTPQSPVPGVKISVFDESGKLVAAGRSGADGQFKIPLPGASIDVLGNSYTVKIDTSTLPKDSYLTNPKQVELTFDIRTDQDITVVFRIGPNLFASDPWYDQALNLLVSGLIFGLVLALASLGLSMVFGTTGLVNFAHGELITFGAIVAYFFDANLGLPVIAAGLVAVLLSAGFGWVQDRGLWQPLRKRGTGLVAMMIVSIGLSLFLRNLYQYLVGADNHNYTQYSTVAPYSIGPVDVTPKDLIVAALCVLTLVAVSIAVQRSRLGKATRAVSDNPALAASSGINVDRVITAVWMIGTALAGMAGIMFGLTSGFDYQVGFKILLLVFASVTLGGLGTIWGAMAGSMMVGLLVEESTLIIPAELKYASALLILILVLLVRPQGLLGRRERVG